MIQYLAWDSDFFGYKIGKVELNADECSWSEKEGMVDYDLLYIFSQRSILIAAPLLDVKLIFSKNTQTADFHPNISEYSALIHSYQDLKTLAYISGHDSRFLKDPFFGVKAFKKLYKRWIDNAILDTETTILVYCIDFIIKGFVTFSKENFNQASIGLIAVSPNTQGLGIGQKLLAAVEASLGSNIMLSVATQETNTGACKFYNSYGFKQIHQHYIYHYEVNTI